TKEGEGVPLVVFALPNEKEERNDFEVAIPKLGSVILTHSLDGTFDPLTSVPSSERPPVTPVFFAFRIMVGLGTLMLLLAWVSAFQLWRRKLLDSPW
ncbi:cytochrome ubiquinol oxidase subunit I, partial [Klebsiella pneumoniae]